MSSHLHPTPDFLSIDPLSRRQLLQRGALVAASACLPPMASAQDVRGTRASRVVNTANGRMQGVSYPDGVEAFFGIPYGESTAGAGRFMPPVPVQSWTGVRETVGVGNRSPQTLGGPLPEVAALDRREPLGEDCLNLNVFTPASGNGRRPVMVWLHGGGFTSGSGGWLLYDGRMLARSQDVVVVTVTHRLNVFGHLHLAGLGGERYSSAGNVGILDIIAALTWVRDNIAAFGGDPANVTIFGQSGGGGKVSTLMAMPAASGLFHKAIIMSGSNLRGIPAQQANETAERYLRALDLRNDQVDRLHEMSMEQLLTTYLNTQGLPMAPVVDDITLPGDPFFPSAPALSANIPTMFGTTEHEVNFMPGTPLDDIDEAELSRRLAQTLNRGEDQVRPLVALYRDGRPDATNVELFQIIASDNSFRRGVQTQAELQAQQASAPVYQYYFRWASPVREGKLRAYHCLDIPFAFNNVDVCASMVGGDQDRYPLASAMSGAFAAFARTGDPNNPALSYWAPFTAEQQSVMVLDRQISLMNDPFGEERRALYALTS